MITLDDSTQAIQARPHAAASASQGRRCVVRTTAGLPSGDEEPLADLAAMIALRSKGKRGAPLASASTLSYEEKSAGSARAVSELDVVRRLFVLVAGRA
jgi:hypothetical protein